VWHYYWELPVAIVREGRRRGAITVDEIGPALVIGVLLSTHWAGVRLAKIECGIDAEESRLLLSVWTVEMHRTD
jgi:hypothetical protein